MKSATPEPRALCARCLRPTRVCVCRLLPTLTPAARVIILQHPRERGMAIGTAKMASRCLAGSSVVVGTHVEAHPTVVAALADPTRTPVLLWPGPGAKDLAVERPAGPITLFVVDGTWTLAGKMIGFNPVIAALPRYAISPKTPSEYRIRREPRAECLSTIEAVSNALGLLEGEPERYRAMMDPFRAMIDAQLAAMAEGPRPRDKSKLMLKRRKVWALPAALAELSRVVVVAAESNAWPVDAKTRHPDEIVHWLAIRGDASERFERIVRPEHPLAPSATSHTELPADVLLGGAPKAEVLAALRAFLRDGDTIATWGGYATRWMADSGLSSATGAVDLRRVAAQALRRSPGSMERCAESLGIVPRRLGQGRGGRRLGLMLAMLEGLAARSGRRPSVLPSGV
jgi:DTW domain-containing protein YfiP